MDQRRSSPWSRLSGLFGPLILGTLGFVTLAVAEEIEVPPPGTQGAVTDLAKVLAAAPPRAVIRLSAGTYELSPVPHRESFCGNCEEPETPVEATAGLIVSGEGIRIMGPREGEAVIHTNAGYGILFEDCQDCALVGVTVTGGVRDPSPDATDAAVVVKRSKVSVLDCTLRDNIGDSTRVAEVVVGIIGIAGREGSDMVIRNNRILRNSWDGITLYRGAKAIIESNIIDGMDLARGDRIGGGRGVGIGVTWDATAEIRGNLVRRYWKGIGGFVDAQITVEENVIEHIATWGLTLWDAGYGRPAGFFLRNVVYDTGACGASIIRTSNDPPFPGRFVQNLMLMTGQDPRYDSGEPYCSQEPIARHAVPQDFAIAGNILHKNRISDDESAPEDVNEKTFRHRVQGLATRLEPWQPLHESDFWKDFGIGEDAP